MTRRRKTLLVVVAIVLLAAGGFLWCWQAMATDGPVNALLDEVRWEPGLVERWGIKLGLGKSRRTRRDGSELVSDLAELGPSAVPELTRALRDSDYRVRCVAAVALGKLGDARGVETLIAALNDKDEQVRALAAEALGELGAPRAVEPLKKLVGDEDADVRAAAAKAVRRLRGQSEGKP